MSLTAAEFPAFYEAVNGYRPFPWQANLVAGVDAHAGLWPAVLDLPTGSGKTSALDAAVFLLALEVTVGEGGVLTPKPVHERNAAVRTFFVVDRRIVVDEAAEKARKLARLLNAAVGGPATLQQAARAVRHTKADAPGPLTAAEVDVIERVAARLRAFVPEDQQHKGTKKRDERRALHVAVLRGGMYRDGSWAESPTQPTVCLSTVDQVGSRLLFRGYGVSPYQRAVHAALVGNDALVLVDEAHLSRPFAETLRAVEFYRSERWAEAGRHVRTPFQAVVLSATAGDPVGPVVDDGRVRPAAVGLTAADRADPKLSRRLAARKLARLEPFPVAKDEAEAVARAGFARRLADRAVELSALTAPATTPAGNDGKKGAKPPAPPPPSAAVVGVVVNRVDTARRVYDLLRARVREHFALDGDDPDDAVILLTGRIRPYDRDELLFRARVVAGVDGWLPFMKAASDRPAPPRVVLFVVATQTVEVGADLSFDALVTEAAPLDALRQRFGRLDRLGVRGESRAVVLGRSDRVKAKDDPVYGGAVAGAWKWLKQVGGKAEVVDFGIDALAMLLGRTPPDPAEVYAPQAHAPVMMPAHIDDWVQTTVSPVPDPDPALFLHGPAAGPPDVSVVWRADVTQEMLGDSDAARKVVALVPPVSMEALPVPVWHVRKWLLTAGGDRAVEPDFTDLEGEADRDPDGDRRGRAGRCRPFLVWRGPDPDDGTAASADPDDVAPGSTIVVPTSYGGCDAFGWDPAHAGEVEDVADDCSWRAKRRPVLRVRPGSDLPARTLAAWGRAGIALDFAGRLAAVEHDADESVGPEWGRVRSLPGWGAVRAVGYPDGSGVVFVARKRQPHPDEPAVGGAEDAPADGDGASFTAVGGRVALADHCRGVRTVTDGFTGLLGLRAELRAALGRAALLHDAGKADPRFQLWLYGHEAAAAKAGFALVAKSDAGGRNAAAVEAARRRAGWPRRGRHEALSVLMVRDDTAAKEGVVDADLFVHLVGTHHGRGRPLWPFDPDPGHPVSGDVVCEIDGARVSARGVRRPEAELMPLGAGWLDSFWRVVGRYGYWGTAYLEALLVLADHRQSNREQEADA